MSALKSLADSSRYSGHGYLHAKARVMALVLVPWARGEFSRFLPLLLIAYVSMAIIVQCSSVFVRCWTSKRKKRKIEHAACCMVHVDVDVLEFTHCFKLI